MKCLFTPELNRETRNEGKGNAEQADRSAIERQLERILQSTRFRKCTQLSRFLRFTVEQTLAGSDAASKETLIGVQIFGHRPDYDPGSDPVVRVEARRLRVKLAEYYEGEGREDPVRVEMPKGGYLPVFNRERLEIPSGAAEAQSLAVLPFAHRATDAALDALSEGLAARLIARLAAGGGLRVVSNTSVLQYKNRAQDARKIGEELSASLILEGSLRRAGKRFRCDAELVSAEDGLHRWAGSFDSGHRDPFAVEDDFASQISSGVRAATIGE
jgi:TolB-like protein